MPLFSAITALRHRHWTHVIRLCARLNGLLTESMLESDVRREALRKNMATGASRAGAPASQIGMVVDYNNLLL